MPSHAALVGTVEHLLAALAGCQIDNAVIEIDGPEVPIMDGSSEPFVFLIECAGIVEQAAIRTAIKILKPVTLEDRREARDAPPRGQQLLAGLRNQVRYRHRRQAEAT